MLDIDVEHLVIHNIRNLIINANLIIKIVLLFKFRLVGKKLELVTKGVNARKRIISILFGVFTLN